MNDLDAIKSRLVLRRIEGHDEDSAARDETESDLDLAIAGWEGTQQAFNLMMDERVNVSTSDAVKFRTALEKIVEVAERSDAHPDVDILSIARKALEDQ